MNLYLYLGSIITDKYARHLTWFVKQELRKQQKVNYSTGLTLRYLIFYKQTQNKRQNMHIH